MINIFLASLTLPIEKKKTLLNQKYEIIPISGRDNLVKNRKSLLHFFPPKGIFLLGLIWKNSSYFSFQFFFFTFGVNESREAWVSYKIAFTETNFEWFKPPDSLKRNIPILKILDTFFGSERLDYGHRPLDSGWNVHIQGRIHE